MTARTHPQELPMSPTSPSPSVKVPHLVLGLVFLGVAATWLLLSTGVLQPDYLPYVGPAVLVGAGVLGLLAMLLGARRGPSPDHGTAHEDPALAPVEESGYEPTQPLPARYSTEDPR